MVHEFCVQYMHLHFKVHVRINDRDIAGLVNRMNYINRFKEACNNLPQKKTVDNIGKYFLRYCNNNLQS